MSISYQPGIGDADDLRLMMSYSPQATGWPIYTPRLHRGWYYLGADTRIAAPIVTITDDPIIDENGDIVTGSLAGTSQILREHYLYGTAPVTDVLVIETGLTPAIYTKGLSQPIVTGTPVTLTHEDDERLFTQLPTVVHVESLPVQQRDDWSLIIRPAYAHLGIIRILSIVNETEATRTAVAAYSDLDDYIVVTGTSRLGDAISLVYLVDDTFAVTADGDIDIVLAPEVGDVTLSATYQADDGSDLYWRDLGVNLYPLVSGFPGGFLWLETSESTPTTITFNTPVVSGILYEGTDSAGPFFHSVAASISVLDTLENPVTGQAVVWTYRKRYENGSTGSWSSIQASGSDSAYQELTAADGASCCYLGGAFLAGLVGPGEYTPATDTFSGCVAIDLRAVSCGLTAVTTLPFTKLSSAGDGLYIHCVISKELTEAGRAYRISAWEDGVDGRQHTVGSSLYFFRVADGVPLCVASAVSADVFPFVATVVDTQHLSSGDRCYAALIGPGGTILRYSNVIMVP